MGFLNRTGAEIGYKLDQKCKKNKFVKNLKNTEIPSPENAIRLFNIMKLDLN